MPRNAGTVSRETGWTNARHPETARGKYFSTFSRSSAKFFTDRRYILSIAGTQGLRYGTGAGLSNRVAEVRATRYNFARRQIPIRRGWRMRGRIRRRPGVRIAFRNAILD